MPRLNLHNIATRNQVLLERLKEGYSRQMVADVQKMVGKSVAYLRTLDTDTLQEVPMKEFKAQLAKLRQAETELLFEGVARQIEDWQLLTEQQVTAEQEVLQSMLPSGRVAPVSHIKAFKAVLQTPLGVDGQMLEPFVKGWAEGAVARSNNMLMKGWQEGKTVQEMVRQLRGTKAKLFKDGIVALESRHAKTIVRTATQHVASASRQELYKANPELVKQYQFVATLDNRTSAICRELDGAVFVVGEGPLPPQHPGCRSSTIPKLGSAFDIFDKGATRSSAEGYVDADLSYYQWLKKQDADFQDTALGKTRGKLFRDGGLTEKRFRELQLNANFEPMTISEMRKEAPQAFKNAGLSD